MPTLLQINTAIAYGAVGTIVENIGNRAAAMGWRSVVAHGPRYHRPNALESLKVNSRGDELIHGLKSLLFDRHGLGSAAATKRLCRLIEDEIRPDIIHLHNIHGYYVNYPVLFEFLNSTDVPVVWTFHDCWPFTGHCSYFDRVECMKWQSQCENCRGLGTYPIALTDNSRANFDLKRSLFARVHNRITIVAVSQWLASMAAKSFFKDCDIRTIHNGIDTDVFKPRSEKDTAPRILLGVANGWSGRKGLDDFIRLSEIISDDYRIVLAGLNKRQGRNLPTNIESYGRIESRERLAALYSRATAFVNPSYEDAFPTVNLEALACGTPVIGYDTGGSPEAFDPQTGIVVAKGDVEGLCKAVVKITDNGFTAGRCRQRAVELFDKDKSIEQYISLYEELLGRRNH